MTLPDAPSAEPQPERETSVPKKRRRRGCGCGTIALTAFVLLVVLPVVAILGTYATLLVSDSYWLERELALAREAGYPLTLEEIEASYPTSPEIEAATAHWQNAIEVVGSDAYKQAAVGVPIVDVETDRNRRVEESLPLSEDRMEIARRFVAEHADVLKEARAAREAGAVARFPVDFEELIHADLSHAEGLCDLARLLQLEAEIHLIDGDADAVVENVLIQIAAADSLANEPMSVSQASRLTCWRIAADTTIELLARGDPTEEKLAALQEAFASQRLMEGYVRAIQGDRYQAQYLVRFDSPIDDPRIEVGPFAIFSDADLAKTLEFHRKLESIARDESPEQFDRFSELEYELEVFRATSATAGLRYRMTCLNVPMLAGISVWWQGRIADLRLVETAIAIERFRLVHGNPPATLDELTPDFLDSPPVDPFGGNPICYRRETSESVAAVAPDASSSPFDEDEPIEPRGPGILLYSFGLDGKDEGGRGDLLGGDVARFIPDPVAVP